MTWTRFNSVFVILLIFFISLYVSSSGRAQPPTTLDSLPIKAMPVQRFVALNSLTADIVFRLDETKLVGRPGTRLLNQNEKLSQIPSVSEGQMLPDVEKILALKPDLVVGSTGFHNPVAQKLEQQGIHTVLTNVDSWFDLKSLTETLANFIAADPKQLLELYQDILGDKLKNSYTTLVLVARDPILAPNKHSWAGDLLTQLSIDNLTGESPNSSPRKGFTSISNEQIITADPKTLIVISTESDRLLEYYKSQPFWNQLQAVKNNKVYAFDSYGLIVPGSIAAIEDTINNLKLIFNK